MRYILAVIVLLSASLMAEAQQRHPQRPARPPVNRARVVVVNPVVASPAYAQLALIRQYQYQQQVAAYQYQLALARQTYRQQLLIQEALWRQQWGFYLGYRW